MSSTPLDVMAELELQEKGKMENLVVRAGAGAGKTTELVKRVLSLAKKHKIEKGQFPFLVVTTFTRKATQELKERLVQKSLELGDHDLIEFVQKQSHLHISTIHGVLSIFLSRFGGMVGLPPQFTVIGEDQEIILIKKIIRQILRESTQGRVHLDILLESYSLSDLIEVFQSYSELDVGGNKISLAQREDLQKLSEEKISSWVTQAESLVSALEIEETSDSWVNYTKCLKSCIQAARAKNYSDQRRALHQFDKVKPIVRKNKNSNPVTIDAKAELQKELKKILENWSLEPAAWDLHQEMGTHFIELGKLISQALKQKKIETGQLTMGDLETYAMNLVKAESESARLFSQEWDYWLIDEYQDTSPRQVQLFKALMGDRNAFVVGDPQQSIYLFRGARSEVFIQREKEVLVQGGKNLKKMENYRSRPEVLEYFNYIFTSLSPQFGKMIPHRAKYPTPNPQPAALYLSGRSDDEEYEVRNVLRRCQQLIQESVSEEEICVLARTHKDLEEIAHKAREIGLPVQVHAPSKFYQRSEIRDALAYLKFLVNPHDNINFLEVLRSPWFHLEDKDIIQICSKNEKSYWVKAVTNLKSQNKTIEKLSQDIDSCFTEGVTQVWVKGLKDSGLLETAHQIDPSGRREANLWKLIHMLQTEERKPGFRYLDFIHNRSDRNLDPDQTSEEGDAVPVIEPKRVNLMTIHASKGLQFDHVIIPAMGRWRPRRTTSMMMLDEESGKLTFSVLHPEEGKMKASVLGEQIGDRRKDRERQEYERLLYVAMTRAKQGVTLIWSDIDKDSWAERIWKPLEIGIENRGLFSVEMKEDLGDLQIENQKLHQSHSLRPAYVFQAQEEVPTISVTTLIEDGAEDLRQPEVKRDIRQSMSKVFQGIQAHALFESLRYQAKAKSLTPTLEKARRFVETWNKGELYKIIQTGHVEWGFCISQGQAWIQGQIDLWGTDDQGTCWVVDYKTGSENHLEKAFFQLKIYAWALAKMKKITTEKIQLAVVYPMTEKVFVRSAPSREDIEREINQNLEL
ncbi:MAG: hypothetical protein BroJett040_22010 [Oligoflexia bacterium]|nr:MAG: hypothetical protein BroJett040_22010 [Oligoflexia bacterium]